jgi:hypothetical protein
VSDLRDIPAQSFTGNSIIPAISAAIICGCAFALTIFSLYLVIILHWQGPFRDLWEFVPFIEKQFQGVWPLDYLLDPYGGAHRIFLPKLFFFADFYWLQGRNLLTTSTALICQCIYLLIVLRIIRNQKNMTLPEKSLLTGYFGMALFSTTQVNNFLYAMDVQWYMSNVLGLASMALLLRKPSGGTITLVMLLGVAAALCNFTGLMALPVAAMALSLQKQNEPDNNWMRWLAYVFVAITCWLYMHHSKNAQHVVISALTLSDNWFTSAYIVQDTLRKMFDYTLRYLASPLSRQWPTAGAILSSISLLAVGLYWLQYFRGRTLTSLQRLCLHVATYIVLSAIATAFGRLIYTNSAVTERYQTLVLPYLPAIAGLIWQDCVKSRIRTLAPITLALLALWHLAPAQLKSAHEMSVLSNRVNLAHTAARAGVLDMAYVSGTLSYPLIKNNINSVKDNDTFLREYRLGYFQHLQEFMLDNTVQIASTLPACDGHVHAARDNERQTWLLDGKLTYQDKPMSDMVLVQNKKVVGLGMLLRPENSLLPLTEQSANESAFRAYAQLDKFDPTNSTVIIGVLDKLTICQITLNTISL